MLVRLRPCRSVSYTFFVDFWIRVWLTIGALTRCAMTRRHISQSKAMEPGSGSPVAWRILALPLAGASLLAAVTANEIGTGGIMNPTLHVLAAKTLALTLLLRIIANAAGTFEIDRQLAAGCGKRRRVYLCSLDYSPPGVDGAEHGACFGVGDSR